MLSGEKMNPYNNTPSLFDNGQIGSGSTVAAPLKVTHLPNLIDLLYDGFYIVFLIKNGYRPQDAEQFRGQIFDLLQRFEQQAKKLQFNADDVYDAKYAYCSLLDETIVTQQSPHFFQLQNTWLINPLQLSLFGSQLAGYHFFEVLEQLRSKGKERLLSLEVFHYCLLLGFQGKYRIDSIESLNHLVARVGDEIDYLKGKNNAFSPFAALPDQIKNIIHRELPFYWILLLLLLFAFASFFGLFYMLSQNQQNTLSQYKNVITAPIEQAHITIHLP